MRSLHLNEQVQVTMTEDEASEIAFWIDQNRYTMPDTLTDIIDELRCVLLTERPIEAKGVND